MKLPQSCPSCALDLTDRDVPDGMDPELFSLVLTDTSTREFVCPGCTHRWGGQSMAEQRAARKAAATQLGAMTGKSRAARRAEGRRRG